MSLRNAGDPPHERVFDIFGKTIRHWVDRFGTYFAHKIRKRRILVAGGFEMPGFGDRCNGGKVKVMMISIERLPKC
jgi:hypothetical protein